MTEQRRPETSVRPGFARDDWNARYAQKELLWTAAPNRRFAEEVAGLAPGRALDLACGEGRNAVWLAERGWEVTGVDFSDVALAKAAELATSRGVEVDWVVADVLGRTSRSRRPSTSSSSCTSSSPARRCSGRFAARRVRSRPAGHCSSSATTRRTSRTVMAARRTRRCSTPPTISSRLLDGLAVEHAGPVRRTVALDQGGEAVAIDALFAGASPRVTRTRALGGRYARGMKTLELDDDELRLLVAAVRSYLDDFGHEEADVLRRVKQLLAKLQAEPVPPA